MNSRLLLNLLLLIIIGALGVFIFTSSDKTETNITRLGGPKAENINTITIQRNGLADIFLEKNNDIWWMSNPYKVRANTVPINALLKFSQTISHSRFSAENKNLRDYDLQPAKASLALNGVEYLFGNIEHINNRRYILKDNTIHLTTDLFYYRLRTNTEAFISPKLIPDNSQITALTLPDLKLNKSAQGEWLVSGKQSTQAFSNDAIQILLDHWHNKQAIQVLPAKINSKEKKVQLVFSDNTKINFLVNKTKNNFILIRKDLGLQYQLPIDAAKDLLTLKQP